MKVVVTPECRHADGWTDHGEPFRGETLTVNPDCVIVDGEIVMKRERDRRKRTAYLGHEWVTPGGGLFPWTGFSVRVEP